MDGDIIVDVVLIMIQRGDIHHIDNKVGRHRINTGC